MKQFKPIAPLLVCLLAISCATTQTNYKDPVVLAEHAIVDSKATFDAFLKLEEANRNWVMSTNPSIHTYAEYIRKNAPGWLLRANNLKNAYKTNSSDANLVNLTAITSVLTQAITMSSTYAQQISTATKSS